MTQELLLGCDAKITYTLTPKTLLPKGYGKADTNHTIALLKSFVSTSSD